MGGDKPNATQLYRRHHARTLLTLRALRRLLVDFPGTRVPGHVFGALATLMALPLCRYPQGASVGVGMATADNEELGTRVGASLAPQAPSILRSFAGGGGGGGSSRRFATRAPERAGDVGDGNGDLEGDDGDQGGFHDDDDDEDGEGAPSVQTLSLLSSFEVSGVEFLPPVLQCLLPADCVAEAVSPGTGVINSPSPALMGGGAGGGFSRRDVAERVRAVACDRTDEPESLLMLAVDVAHMAVVPSLQQEARSVVFVIACVVVVVVVLTVVPHFLC